MLLREGWNRLTTAVLVASTIVAFAALTAGFFGFLDGGTFSLTVLTGVGTAALAILMLAAQLARPRT